MDAHAFMYFKNHEHCQHCIFRKLRVVDVCFVFLSLSLTRFPQNATRVSQKYQQHENFVFILFSFLFMPRGRWKKRQKEANRQTTHKSRAFCHNSERKREFVFINKCPLFFSCKIMIMRSAILIIISGRSLSQPNMHLKVSVTVMALSLANNL